MLRHCAYIATENLHSFCCWCGVKLKKLLIHFILPNMTVTLEFFIPLDPRGGCFLRCYPGSRAAQTDFKTTTFSHEGNYARTQLYFVTFLFYRTTHTDNRLGSNQWGLGPTAVALRIDGPWLYGALANNVWSLGDGNSHAAYNNFLLQPFVNYNFGKTGTYLVGSPILTANWKTGQWVVPLGGGMGQIFKMFGKQAVNAYLQAFYNVAHPDNLGPEWTLRFQLQFLFPK
jgi:hypothetical protein